ncbi:hypothetical protein TREMEDRAFT_65081 [Tremella mesenterica DSM 1558]|uniref:uncharacterized protein n=1 Tax=Tremella mesenterica (strain ATCC 24925 / CBS 8224 / DSM 1558 / NBRC 9311 / NRRL Y-6157 / RJB 2259-6 / UBC 559-6) TaxID=578456 RepID=UPI00032C91FD|nr:uncharacterized protein TREMEDRAFT_65081 [Tremella mesenterica DSM 1558]EIW66689.1 hypothetical protein TREMEDRAFT_65081 [Tremella mesenterica DSM 1558]
MSPNIHKEEALGPSSAQEHERYELWRFLHHWANTAQYEFETLNVVQEWLLHFAMQHMNNESQANSVQLFWHLLTASDICENGSDNLKQWLLVRNDSFDEEKLRDLSWTPRRTEGRDSAGSVHEEDQPNCVLPKQIVPIVWSHLEQSTYGSKTEVLVSAKTNLMKTPVDSNENPKEIFSFDTMISAWKSPNGMPTESSSAVTTEAAHSATLIRINALSNSLAKWGDKYQAECSKHFSCSVTHAADTTPALDNKEEWRQLTQNEAERAAFEYLDTIWNTLDKDKTSINMQALSPSRLNLEKSFE